MEELTSRFQQLTASDAAYTGVVGAGEEEEELYKFSAGTHANAEVDITKVSVPKSKGVWSGVSEAEGDEQAVPILVHVPPTPPTRTASSTLADFDSVPSPRPRSLTIRLAATKRWSQHQLISRRSRNNSPPTPRPMKKPKPRMTRTLPPTQMAMARTRKSQKSQFLPPRTNARRFPFRRQVCCRRRYSQDRCQVRLLQARYHLCVRSGRRCCSCGS